MENLYVSNKTNIEICDERNISTLKLFFPYKFLESFYELKCIFPGLFCDLKWSGLTFVSRTEMTMMANNEQVK